MEKLDHLVENLLLARAQHCASDDQETISWTC
jgi:hypothetical protein